MKISQILFSFALAVVLILTSGLAFAGPPEGMFPPEAGFP